MSRIIDDRKFIAGHRVAGASRDEPVPRGREINVQHLGGTDPVQYLDSKTFLPAAKHFGGKWLRG